MNDMRETIQLRDENDKYQFEVSAVYDQKHQRWVMEIKSWTDFDDVWEEIPFSDFTSFTVPIRSREAHRKGLTIAIDKLSPELTLYGLLFSVSVSNGTRTLFLDILDAALYTYLGRDPRFSALVHEHYSRGYL